MKINLLYNNILFLFQSQTQGQKAVYFQSDSSTLSKDVRSQIDAVISDLTVKKEFVKKLHSRVTLIATAHRHTMRSSPWSEPNG